MKHFIFLFTLLASSLSFGDPTSFDITLKGFNGNPPPVATDLAFRKIVAEFVQNLDVQKYILKDAPVGGGFHVCIEPAGTTGYTNIIDKLMTISAGGQAQWDVELVENCDDAAELPGQSPI